MVLFANLDTILSIVHDGAHTIATVHLFDARFPILYLNKFRLIIKSKTNFAFEL